VNTFRTSCNNYLYLSNGSIIDGIHSSFKKKGYHSINNNQSGKKILQKHCPFIIHRGTTAGLTHLQAMPRFSSTPVMFIIGEQVAVKKL
jgi:hypothetical protein